MKILSCKKNNPCTKNDLQGRIQYRTIPMFCGFSYLLCLYFSFDSGMFLVKAFIRYPFYPKDFRRWQIY